MITPEWVPLPAEVAVAMDRQVPIIEQAYPAWRVEWLTLPTGAPGGWRATRHAPLGPAELAAGLVAWIVAPDHVDLLMRLAAQDAIAHPHRYAFHEPSA